MLTALLESHKRDVFDIAVSIEQLDEQGFASMFDAMTHRALQSGDQIFEMEQPCANEYFVLTGILRLFVLSPEGDEVTLNFTRGPGVLPPAISRTVNGDSLVSCDALSDVQVVTLPTETLVQQMVSRPQVQRWGDAVMRAELLRRTDREFGLATKTAKQRLQEFRKHYAELEDFVPHPMIASYLGVTPVTLSRLRND